jgi:hypothetical protein
LGLVPIYKRIPTYKTCIIWIPYEQLMSSLKVYL